LVINNTDLNAIFNKMKRQAIGRNYFLIISPKALSGLFVFILLKTFITSRFDFIKIIPSLQPAYPESGTQMTEDS
jgi:hypothetical protein